MNDLMNKMFSEMDSGSIEKFRRLAEEWVRGTAVEIVGAGDENILHALRGRMQICIELADGAAKALADREEKANSALVGRIPGVLCDTGNTSPDSAVCGSGRQH